MVCSDQHWMEKLDQEKALFDEILALSERQLLLFTDKKVNDDEITAHFNQLIGERQKRIDRAIAVRDELRAETGGDPVRVNQYEARQQEIETLVEKIGEKDKESLSLARQVLKGFGEQLKNVRQNKQVFKAYGAAVPPSATGWFVDRKK